MEKQRPYRELDSFKGQLNFGLLTPTAEEALQRFGEGKILNLDFARKINAVVEENKDDYANGVPVATLLVYNEKQRRRILSEARRFRKHDLGTYGKMLQEFIEKRDTEGANSQLDQVITKLEGILENIRQSIDVELAPKSWQTFMDRLTSNQKGALVRALGSIHDLTHSVRMSYVEGSPAMTIGDLRKKDLGSINSGAKRTSSLSEVFLMVAFKEVGQETR